MMPSMFEKQNFVFNYRFYADAIGIHTLNKLPLEKNANMEALKKIAIYRVLNGNEIE